MASTFETVFESEVLVVGGGLAGMLAALEASMEGASVALFTKGRVGLSGSSAISQTVFLVFEGERVEDFLKGVYEAGRKLNDLSLLKIVIERGASAVRRLQELGVPLHGGRVNEDGSRFYSIRRGRSADLVLPLREAFLFRGIPVYEGFQLIDLIKDGDYVNGALFMKDGKIFLVGAKAVVLATGGYARIYSYNDNTVHTTGEGLISALKAGAKLVDLEFVQFYPYWLVSPAWVGIYASLFALGARLKNSKGEYFLSKYPKGELETRDVLAREIFLQDEVFLDLSSLSDSIIEEINPILYKVLRKYGRDNLKVSPVAHFTMGGIKIDDSCFTGVGGLFACGECAAGVHGANRLGGMALTECATLGLLAGRVSAQYAKGVEPKKVRVEAPSLPKEGDDPLIDLEKSLGKVMWKYAGILRDEESLKLAMEEIYKLKECFEMRKPKSLEHWLRLKSMFELSELLIQASLLRRESRGAHWRSDFPREDEAWQKHIAFSRIHDKIFLELLS